MKRQLISSAEAEALKGVTKKATKLNNIKNEETSQVF